MIWNGLVLIFNPLVSIVSSEVIMEQMTERDKARFWTKVKTSEFCWEWICSKNDDGYGVFRHRGESLSHRISYQLINGNIDIGDHILHKCDNPSCVNPDHLLVGSHQQNMHDKMSKGRSRMIGRASKFRGVTWRTDSKRWRAYVVINKKTKYIGCFKDEIEAAIAHDKEAYHHFGKTYPFNFPEKIIYLITNPPKE